MRRRSSRRLVKRNNGESIGVISEDTNDLGARDVRKRGEKRRESGARKEGDQNPPSNLRKMGDWEDEATH